jgi:uncharacterized protein with NAD-binding domain and iron-sulfur cluster
MANPKRIVILGGGVGALTAAYYLTSRSGWQDEYEITLYQIGWRLGGKGASGRNPDAGNRIEEHGLHVWMGNYENAFALMRACYGELARPVGSPMATVEEAFTPRTHLTLFERVGESWEPWPIHAPVLPGTPGTDTNVPTPWEVVVRILDFAASQGDVLLDSVEHALPSPMALPDWVHALAARIEGPIEQPARTLVHHAAMLARTVIDAVVSSQDEIWSAIAHLVEAFRAHVRSTIWPAVQSHTVLRRACLCLDLATSLVSGIVRDRLLVSGLGSIDGEELQAWLRRHGASEETIGSSPIRGLYDLCFAYADGDRTRPCFAAGTALAVLLRVAFSYRGPVLYEMNAGMGEVVVAPLYQVLRRRGVRVEFFNRVTSLEPSANGRSVGRIRIGRQVRVKASLYEPLVEIGGLECWPDRPLAAQLSDDDRRRVEQGRVNLESAWNGWDDVETRVLEQGTDFDHVVLGISLGGLRTIASPLAAVNGAWRDLLDNIPCIQTQTLQLWLKESPVTDDSLAPLTSVGAAEPLDTWADMSHLLPRESWPRGTGPSALHYICGPMSGDFSGRALTDRSTPAAARSAVEQTVIEWLTRRSGWEWPAIAIGGTTAFDWKMLYADAAIEGPARLATQYIRANIDPTELYVLSPPDAQKYRLPSDQSGFDNLVLAGDWTRTAINAGCVEAAVMSGMAASRAITGIPTAIAGEHFMQG